MPYIPKEQIEQARELDLLSYLQRYEPHNLVRLSASTYCTKEHDSLKISNGLWHWHSQGIGGRSALDYLIKVEGMALPEAVQHLLGAPVVKEAPELPVPPKKEFELPLRNRDDIRVISYLRSRGIDYPVIMFCIEKDLLYESAKYHNAVFVGKDPQGTARYASLRGTRGKFRGEIEGSDKRYAFRLMAAKGSDTVHVFESAIDALSYATLLRRKAEDWKAVNHLCLGGVSMQDGFLPRALEQYLDCNKNTKEIVLHLDNDRGGRKATDRIVKLLGGSMRVVDATPQGFKDVNDLLMNQKEKTGVCRER